MNINTDKMYGKRLKVFNIPDRITEAELRQIFSNQRKNGGGPINEMIIFSSSKERYAIITFEDTDAVTTIMSRGNIVPVLDFSLKVQPFLEKELNLLNCQMEREENLKMQSMKQSELKSEDALFSSLNLDNKWSHRLSRSNPDKFVHSHSEIQPDINFVHIDSEKKSEMESLNSNLEVKSEMEFLNSYLEVKSEMESLNSNLEVNLEVKSEMESLNSNLEVKSEMESLNSNLEVKSEMESLNSNLEVKSEMESLNSNLEVKSEMESLNSNLEVKSEMESLNLNLEVKSEMAMTVENDVLKRTIKASISKRHISKQYYELYLDDIDLNEYEPDSMMLDGLHKNVYITFNKEADAEKFCQIDHDTESSNITKVTMATLNDFNTYNNRILLIGSKFPSSERLKKLLKEKTKIEVKEIIQSQELSAVVVIFDENVCLDITPFTWELTNLNGLKMITAPVIRENALIVCGLNGIPKIMLERYVKSKKFSGGGPLKSIEIIDDNQASVVFKNETDFENFTNKSNHELEKCKLKVSVFHSCLQINYLQELISEKDLKELTKTKPGDPMSSQVPKSVEPIDNLSSEVLISSKHSDHLLSEVSKSSELTESQSQKERSGSRKSVSKKEIQLNPHEFFLLYKSNMFKKINQMHRNVKIVLHTDSQKVVLKSTEKSALANMEIDILKLCKSEIKSISFNSMTSDQMKFLEQENVIEKLNSLMPYGYLKSTADGIEIFYMNSEDPNPLISQLQKQFFVHKKQISLECVNALESTKGLLFLANIDANLNRSKTYINLEADSRTLAFFGPEKEIIDIVNVVDRFLDENKLITEEVQFSEGKKNFLYKYMQKEISDLQFDTDTELKSFPDIVIVRGFKEAVKECSFRLKNMRDNIYEDSITLKFYGIYEFLTSHEVLFFLKELEGKNRCAIMLKNGASPDKLDKFMTERHLPELSKEQAVEKEERIKQDKKYSQVKANFGQLEVILEEGVINNQKADIIVVTVDKSLDLTKGRISKTVLEKAGEEIQHELKSKYRYGILHGDVAITSGGRMSCRYIFYACMSRFKEPLDSSESKTSLQNMRNLIVEILKKAHQHHAQTISIPALGTGGLGYPADISAKLTLDVIKDFTLKYSSSSIKSIKLVVYPTDTAVLMAFRDVVLSNGKSSGRAKDNFKCDKKADVNRSIQYGNIRLIIEQGDITKESVCEAIVVSINANMDFSKSGKVCRNLLDISQAELQQECSRGKYIMEQKGILMTSAPNLKCKRVIFISQEKFSACWDLGVSTVLKEAENSRIKSVALPFFGAGSRHADLRKMKKDLLTAIEKFSKNKQINLNLIKLVIFDQKILDIFLENEQDITSSSCDKNAESWRKRDLSSETVIDIYSNYKQNVEAAKTELEEICYKNYIKTRIEKEGIRLSKKKFEELSIFGLQKGMKMTVIMDKNEVLIEGFNSEGFKEIEAKLLSALNDNDKGSCYKPKGPTVVWQFKRGERWFNFEPLLNCQLEDDYTKKSKGVRVTDSNNEISYIDLIDLEQITMDSKGKPVKTYKIQRIEKK